MEYYMCAIAATIGAVAPVLALCALHLHRILGERDDATRDAWLADDSAHMCAIVASDIVARERMLLRLASLRLDVAQASEFATLSRYIAWREETAEAEFTLRNQELTAMEDALSMVCDPIGIN